MNSPIMKKFIIGVVIAIVLVFVYTKFLKSDTPAGTLSSSTIGDTSVAGIAVNTQVGGELLSTLLNLKTIKLNDQIFSSPLFSSLTDFTITLGSGVEGRPNPFAPIGTDITPAPTPVDTIQPPTSDIDTTTVSVVAKTMLASNVTKTTALLHGSVDKNTVAFSAWFEWNKVGVTTPAIKTTPVNFAGSVASFSTPITGLSSNTAYTFKAFVKIGDLTLSGASDAFTTPAL
jgi:hypothetical protein